MLLREHYDYYSNDGDYIVVNVNPHRDILEELASGLLEKDKLKKLFLEAHLNISFKGIGFSLEGNEPVSSVFHVVRRVVEYLNKIGKKIIITIDEVLTTYDEKLKINSYDKIWMSVSNKEKEMLSLMADGYCSVSEL